MKCKQLLQAQHQTEANCVLPVQQEMRSTMGFSSNCVLSSQVTSVYEHDLTS